MLEEDVIEAPVEQEVVEQVEKPVNDKPLSVRDSLAAAVEEVKLKEKEPKVEKKADDKVEKTDKKLTKESNIDKLAKEPSLKTSKAAKDVAPVVEQQLSEVKVPQSFQGANAPMWKQMPRNVQEFVAKREDEFHRELTKQDEERNFGKQVKELSTPYLPLIKAERGDVIKSFEQYLNTAYQLRTGTPQAKGQLILRLAQEFGADLRGAAQQAQSPVNPAVQQLQQELQTLRGSIEQEKALKKQQEESALQTEVEAFAANPEHVHFETVKADMAALLRGGIAKDLKDAYDRAVYANPQTRSILLEKQEEEKRVANDKKAKAEAAKRAGSSVRGGPGPSALKNGNIVQHDLRKALASAFAEHRGEA